ncbi:MAG: DUF2080 family transposase-associated protein [candidate division Zixibacteria bacterium]|jgi:hypothetical protein|nr:DUF2080 family transposase-associated protein [candidate division Zixibacteria bacterium]
METNSHDDWFVADQRCAIASHMATVARLLMAPTLTDDEYRKIQTEMQHIRYLAMGVPKGLDNEIAELAVCVAVRCVADSRAILPSAPVMPFGNGAHAVLPKELIGKTIRYVVDQK